MEELRDDISWNRSGSLPIEIYNDISKRFWSKCSRLVSVALNEMVAKRSVLWNHVVTFRHWTDSVTKERHREKLMNSKSRFCTIHSIVQSCVPELHPHIVFGD